MLFGELTVTGRDSITIPLHRDRHPRDIMVRFHGEPCHIPCDRRHEDFLEWECSQDAEWGHRVDDQDSDDDDWGGRDRDPDRHKNYYLTILWDVSGSRDIQWEVRW